MGSEIADTLKVAVVMPVYNSREYLTEAVNSVLRQKYRNFILVAVDDGSTDGSLEILNRIEGRTDHLVVISKNNGGVSSARNVALEYIEKSGDFDAVCFCDSDDVVTDNFIETFVRLMEKYEADYVVSSVFRWFKNLDCPLSVGGERSFALSSNEAFLHFLGDPLFKKKAPASVSGLITNRCYRLLSIRGLRFREDLSSAEDQEFALRVFQRIKKGVVTEAVTYFYRQRKGSLVRSAGNLNSNIKYVRELIELWEKEKGWLKQAFALYIIHFWWGLVVKTYRKKKGERKNKEALREVFNVIERRRMSKNVSLKYKKRLFIFGFGDMIVQLYFRLKFSKTREMVYFE